MKVRLRFTIERVLKSVYSAGNNFMSLLSIGLQELNIVREGIVTNVCNMFGKLSIKNMLPNKNLSACRIFVNLNLTS